MRKNKYTKLSEKQIEEIRNLHSGGYSIASIAKEYQVSTSTIWYWTISDERRQNEIKNSTEYKKITNKKTPYNSKVAKLFYVRHRKELNLKKREYYLKNKEKICKRMRDNYHNSKI